MNNNRTRIPRPTPWRLFLPLAFLWFPLSVAAETILARYEFPNPDAYELPSLSSSDTDPQITAGDLVINFPAYSAGTTKTAGGTVHVKSTVVEGTPDEPGDEAGAVKSGQYFSFTVEPEQGRRIKLTTLSFDILLDADPESDPSPGATWLVKTSIGGFGVTDPTLGTVEAPVSQSDDDIKTIDPLIDLSGLPMLTSPIEIRIYVVDNQHSSGVIHRLDNIILKGKI